MTPNRIWLHRFALCAALVVAGCSKSTPITAPEPPAGRLQDPARGTLADDSNVATLQGHRFVPRSDHPLFPLVPGTTFRYRSETPDGVEDEVFTVTRETKRIQGVSTRVVEDIVHLDGTLTEHTFDYFASDELGNVWYFGEDSRSRDPQTGEVSTEGSWRAGRDGAEAGIIMEAHPQVGDVYHEEHAAGVAEDQARVLALDAQASVPAGSYSNCLQTENFSALDPGAIEHKFYVPGVGLVLEIDVNGNTRNELVKVTRRDSGDDDGDGHGDDEEDGAVRNRVSRVTLPPPSRPTGGGAR